MHTPNPWIVLALAVAGAGGVSGQDYPPEEPLEARVWLDRGDEPVLQRGERVRLYYRTSADAYLAIFHIDTDGSVQLLFPRSPDDDDFVRGGQDYRLLFPTSPYWYVDEYPGQGYFFVLASPVPLDYGELGYSRYDRSWDLTPVGRTVYEDPYVAMDDYVASLLPNWEEVSYALDFVSYDVGETHDYPRFLCYDCHGFQSYAAWNPYSYACSSFRVVVWDDPYFYPAYRYGGTRVVFATPRRGVPRFEFTRRSPGEAWSTVRRTRQPPLRRVEYAEPGVAGPPRGDFVPPRRAIVPTDRIRSGDRGSQGTTRTIRPGSGVTRPGTTSRPGSSGVAGSRPSTGRSTGVVRPPASGRGAVGPPSRGDRPVLERRPPSSRGSARPSTSGSPSRGVGARPSTSRGSTGGSRVVRPPARSGGGGEARAPARPAARPAPRATPSKSGAKPGRPAARPPARKPPGSAAARARPRGGSTGTG